MTKKLTLGLVAGLAASLLLSSCETSRKEKVENDCSSAFETRYVNAENNTYTTKKKTVKTVDNEEMTAKEKPATECKILEIKLDDKTNCQIVGSDKIDNLSKVLSENKLNKIILITPQDKLKQLSQMAQSYLLASGIDVKKHFDSDLVKNLNFPYKGMKCVSAGKEIVIWSGEKKVIVTIENL